MAVAKRVSAVEPNNLDWLEIEDEEGASTATSRGSGLLGSLCGTFTESGGVATKGCGHLFSTRTVKPGKCF